MIRRMAATRAAASALLEEPGALWPGSVRGDLLLRRGIGKKFFERRAVQAGQVAQLEGSDFLDPAFHAGKGGLVPTEPVRRLRLREGYRVPGNREAPAQNLQEGPVLFY